MILRERVILAKEQEELNRINKAMEPEEAIQNFEETHGQDLENISNDLNTVDEIDDNINKIDDSIEKLENNNNPTEADVIAAEMLISSIKYNCGLSNKQIGIESIKKTYSNPKQEIKRLVREFKSTRNELELAREGFIKDMVGKIASVVKGFKDTVSDSAKKLIATVKGQKGDFLVKKDCKLVPELGIDVVKTAFEYDVSKAALYDIIFNTKNKYDLNNIKSAKKISFTSSYAQEVYKLMCVVIHFGELFSNYIKENKTDSNESRAAFSRYINTLAALQKNLSKMLNNDLDLLNNKGTTIQLDAVKTNMESVIKNHSKVVTKDNWESGLTEVTPHDTLFKELNELMAVTDAIAELIGKEAGDKQESNLDGLNRGLALDTMLSRFIVSHISGFMVCCNTSLLYLKATNDLYDAARKTEQSK